MKTKTLLITLAALALPTLAQADCKTCKVKPQHAAFMEKFDTDGDGKLSDAEREVAKAARAAKKAEFLAANDTDGDGKLSQDEKKAAHAAFIAKYDSDSDGKLSKEERKVAQDAGEHFPHRAHKKAGKKQQRMHKHGAKKEVPST